MDPALAALMPLLEPGHGHSDVLSWACPVPFFGHLESACLATVGINPSDREFTAKNGAELTGPAQRLPTLRSLTLPDWADADERARKEIAAACCSYFERNPYQRWFGVLQQLIEPTGLSYYVPGSDACHLDIVPWATSRKWGLLPTTSKVALLHRAEQAVARVIAYSPLMMLVLNGREVVRQFEFLVGQRLEPAKVRAWDLARHNGQAVAGVAYRAAITEIAGIPLGREILVAGYNHNLQSSFGVSSAVRAAISEWIAVQYRAFNDHRPAVPATVSG
jgi:hypothetical protein